MRDAVIGLGANLGHPLRVFRRVVATLGSGGDEVVAISGVFRTFPVGGPPQPDFLNAAVRVRSPRSPRELLDRLLALETAEGRERTERWGPRTLDLDLLWMHGVNVAEPGLEVPHPRLAERWFALAPLVEVAPEATDPSGTPWSSWLARLPPGGERVGVF